MAKVDGSLKSLLQGVSQQPPRDRLAGQCTVQTNMSSDPVVGLTRRAPTDLVNSLGSSSTMRGWHNFETRDGNKFLAKFEDGTVSVTDYNGDPFTVTIDSNAEAYITTAGQLVFGTVENQVITVNRSVVPEMNSATKTFANIGSTPMAIIQVLGGQYGRKYTITMNGTVIATYIPPNGSVATDTAFIRTSHIANRLYECMTQTAGTSSPDGATSSQIKTNALASGYTVTLFEDCILIKKNSSGTFKMSCNDDAGNINMKVMTESVSDIADLPRVAPVGYLARVATETDPEEDLFLQFMVDGNTVVGTGFGSPGYWQESIASGTKYQINAATMPHVLEYDPVTQDFNFRRGVWDERNAGTETSNPEPSFIGNPIQDVSTFQSRLVLLAGNYVIMSRTNHYTDFWMASAQSLVESDPIDISSTATEASRMLSAVPHNRDLVVFSAKGQFVCFGRTALTPANATLVLTTAFEAELYAKPVPSGRNVFFATNYGRFTGIREFYTESNSDSNDTRPITQHVKEYLVGKVSRMIASSNYDTLLVQTQADRNRLYAYQYIWSDTEKIQSAWSTWEFPYESVFMFFDEELVYLVMQDGTDFFLHRMSLDVYDDTSFGYPVHLDTRFDVSNVYTQFVLPYDNLHDTPLVAVQSTDCPNPGMAVPIDDITYDVVNSWYVATLRYNMQGGDIIVGNPYMSEYWPTMPLPKDQDGVVMATAKLRVKNFIVSLGDTGYINGQLMSKYGNGEVVSFSGRIINDPGNILGQASLTDEKFIMPFREDTSRAEVRFYTDSHLPMSMLDVEYIGQMTKRGQRISNGGN